MNSEDSTYEHRQVWDLIPWVLNNTANDEERREVEQHVERCSDCRDEFEFQRLLQARVSRGDGLQGNPRPALDRLWARIDDTVLPAAAAWQRPAGSSWLVRGLALAVLLEAIGLGAAGTALWTPATQQPAASYQTLTAPAAELPGASIRIVFAPSLSLAQVAAILQPLQLQIVGGPGPAGSFSLASAGPLTPALLKALRGQAGVRMAEPIGDTAALDNAAAAR